MPTFLYTARDRTGGAFTGSVDADTDQGAMAALRAKGLWVTDLRPAAGAPPSPAPARPQPPLDIGSGYVGERTHPAPYPPPGAVPPPDGVSAAPGATPPPQFGARVTGFRPGPTLEPQAAAEYRPSPRPQADQSFGKRLRSPVSLKDLSLFYRQFHTLLNSGVPVYGSLEMLCDPGQSPNAALRRVVQDLSRQVLNGHRISEGMARCPWLFERMHLRMVEAGESGGFLVQVLKRLADYTEREYQIRLEIKRKTLYPKLVLGLLILVLPINVPLTLAGYLGDLTHLLFNIGIVAAAAWFALRTFVTSESGKQLYDQVKLALPVVGPLVRKLAAARFARGLAALYGAGVPISAAVGMAGEASGNYILESKSRVAVPAIERGLSISLALQGMGFFPPMFTGMVATGETSGNLDVILDKAADFYEEESMHATAQLTIILGVAALIAVAILVVIRLIGFYTGLFSGIMNAAGGAGE